jgi:hypothetical protein
MWVARDGAVGQVLRFAADPGAGIVEQRPFGGQLPFLSNHCRTPTLAS